MNGLDFKTISSVGNVVNHYYWFLQIIPKNFGGVWYMCLKNMYFVVWKWKYVWVKKCMKIRVILFKTENCLSGCTKHPFACLQFFSIGILLTKAWDSLLYWWLIFGFEVWRLRLCLVAVKRFPENTYFPEMLISGKGKYFHVFGCISKNFPENIFWCLEKKKENTTQKKLKHSSNSSSWISRRCDLAKARSRSTARSRRREIAINGTIS